MSPQREIPSRSAAGQVVLENALVRTPTGWALHVAGENLATDYRIDLLDPIDALALADEFAVWDASVSGPRALTASQLMTALGLPPAPVTLTGTFTPSLSFAGANVGISYSGVAGQTQAGAYVKIGTLVFITARFTLTAKGSSVGQARLEGLPFPVAFINAPGNIYASVLTGMAATEELQMLFMAGTSYAALWRHHWNAAATTLTDVQVAATSQFVYSGVYTTT